MAEIERALEHYSLAPVVKALMGLRGVNVTTAFTIVAELGDLSRFDSAPQLMAYLGLVPSEASSGTKTTRGGITKTGNGPVRRVIVEAAWSYRYYARMTQPILLRQKGLTADICALSWEAQKRLSHRYRHLNNAGKRKTVVAPAIARELSGFTWAIGCHMMGRPVGIPAASEERGKAG